jgi:hypothetical protein
VHRVLCISLFLALCACPLSDVTAQIDPQHSIPGAGQPGSSQNEGPGIPPEMRRSMEKKANQQRQAELKRDTERLLKLSTELKEYVDKTNENILSLDVVKKADEIEKLAHSVKMKMRGDQYPGTILP